MTRRSMPYGRLAIMIAVLSLGVSCGSGGEDETQLPTESETPTPLCDPYGDPRKQDFYSLEDADPLPEPILGDVTYKTTVTNKLSQEFEVTISGSAELVPSYLGKEGSEPAARVCLEALQIAEVGDGQPTRSLSEFVVQAAAVKTGKDEADFIAYRAEEIAAGRAAPSLADMTEAFGGSRQEVADFAVRLASPVLDLDEDELAGAVREILDLSGARFLGDPADAPIDPPSLTALAETDDIVVVEFELVAADLDDTQGIAIQYLIDPVIAPREIRADRTHVYGAKCHNGATANLRAETGAMILHLWRVGIDGKIGEVSEPAISWGIDTVQLTKPSNGRRTFDVSVEGVRFGKYEIWGLWEYEDFRDAAKPC